MLVACCNFDFFFYFTFLHKPKMKKSNFAPSAQASAAATSAKYANKLANALSKIELYKQRKQLHEIEEKLQKVYQELKQFQENFGDQIEVHDRICNKIEHLLELKAQVDKMEKISSIVSKDIDEESKAREILALED